MFTIEGERVHEIVINKSTFISHIKHVETVEDAMNVTQKEYSKLKKKAEKSKNTVVKEKTSISNSVEPEWFNKDIDINETTEDEEEELDKILKGLV